MNLKIKEGYGEVHKTLAPRLVNDYDDTVQCVEYAGPIFYVMNMFQAHAFGKTKGMMNISKVCLCDKV